MNVAFAPSSRSFATFPLTPPLQQRTSVVS